MIIIIIAIIMHSSNLSGKHKNKNWSSCLDFNLLILFSFCGHYKFRWFFQDR